MFIDFIGAESLNIISSYSSTEFQLIDSTTLKREVAEGVDLMVVRELTAGLFRDTEVIFKKLHISSIHGWSFTFS